MQKLEGFRGNFIIHEDENITQVVCLLDFLQIDERKVQSQV